MILTTNALSWTEFYISVNLRICSNMCSKISRDISRLPFEGMIVPIISDFNISYITSLSYETLNGREAWNSSKISLCIPESAKSIEYAQIRSKVCSKIWFLALN